MGAPQLLNIDGDLYLDPEKILLCIYPAGDCDRIRAKNPNQNNLRSALYDARETGELPLDCKSVLLPSGAAFYID